MPDINPTAASLLGFLHRGPMSGWDLEKAIEVSVGHFWNVTRSQIYRELKSLEASGLIEPGVAGPRDKRPFRITAAGRSAFRRWIARDLDSEPVRVPLLLRIFFGRQLEPERLDELIKLERERIEQELDGYRTLEQAMGGNDPYGLATLRHGILHDEAKLRWMDELPGLLDGAR